MSLISNLRSKTSLLIAVICLVLVACEGTKLPTPAYGTPSSVSPTEIRSQTSQAMLSTTPIPPTAEPIRSPSATSLFPKITPTIPVQTSTPTFTLSAGDQSTLEAESALEATMYAKVVTEMALLPGCDSPIKHFYSPDGNWVSIQCVNPITYVYNINDKSRVWSLKYNQIFGLTDERQNQFFYIFPWHWSVDGRYLYLSIYPCCMDGGCPAYHDGEALVRLDLMTGEVTQTLRSREAFGLYSFSFSPGDNFLGYLRTWLKHPILNIENLVTGAEQQIPLGEQYDEAGDVIWSPDKSQIIISARTLTDCENMVFYLIKIDLNDLSQEVLWQGTNEGWLAIEWTEDNLIILDNYFWSDYASLDLTTLKIVPYVTPTPTTRP